MQRREEARLQLRGARSEPEDAGAWRSRERAKPDRELNAGLRLASFESHQTAFSSTSFNASFACPDISATRLSAKAPPLALAWDPPRVVKHFHRPTEQLLIHDLSRPQ